MKYMLDTNIVIYLIKKQPESVLQKLQEYDPSDFCISSITLAEMEYGIAKSTSPEKNQAALSAFLSNIDILPFDDRAAVDYGDIRASLEKKGTPIGPNDMLIAAHARSLGLTIVTNNVREFRRVDGLMLDNWV